MKKFLIIQTAFIGDVVLTTSLIEKLHQFYPNAQIDFLVRKGNEGLLEPNPLIKNILIWDKKNGKYKHLFQLLKQIRATNYDEIINTHRFFATGILTAFGKAKKSVGFDKNPLSAFFSKTIPFKINLPEGKIEHETERNQRLISDITDTAAAKPRLYPSLAQMEKVKPYKTQPYICIAPSSVWYTKRLPTHKWIEFLKAIPTDLIVYLLGAKSDQPLCQEIIEKSGNKAVNSLAGKLSMLESAALQKDAVMNYTNDSAPLHFASALNAPIAGIYCSTARILGFWPLSDVSYFIETKEHLDCRPCGAHGHKTCPKGHFKCGEDIAIQQLLEVLPAKNLETNH